jgi:hypothetical protein
LLGRLHVPERRDDETGDVEQYFGRNDPGEGKSWMGLKANGQSSVARCQ